MIFSYHSFTHFELIDTLWNVNVLTAYKYCAVTRELIDTLWNVNDFG